MRLSRRFKYLMSVPVFLVATVALQFSGISTVSAASITWDGSAGDNKFSTAANWSTDSVPSYGDTLNFSVEGQSTRMVIDNDLTGLSIAGITLGGTSINNDALYEITGNAITLTGNVSNTAVGPGSYVSVLELNIPVTVGASIGVTGTVRFKYLTLGANNITVTNNGEVARGYSGSIDGLNGSGNVSISCNANYSIRGNNTGYTGSISVDSGYLLAIEPSSVNYSAGITATGDGTVNLYSITNSTWTTPMTLGGSGRLMPQHSFPYPEVPSEAVLTATLNGAVNLTSNFLFDGSDNMVIAGTFNQNGHTLSVKPGATGSLTTPEGGAQEAPVVDTKVEGDKPDENLTVGYRETVTLNGSRGHVDVIEGGVFKGVGTVASLIVDLDSIVAPGNSPGTITVLDTLTINQGTLQIELQNTKAYDKLVVGENYSGTLSAVTLGTGAKLVLSLFEGWAINEGDQFTIIDNLSDTDVAGVFTDLTEGKQFVLDGITFSITYKGGDGNDVVVTALNTGTDPTPPNTGAMKLVKSNPLLVASMGIITAVTFSGLALKRRQLK